MKSQSIIRPVLLFNLHHPRDRENKKRKRFSHATTSFLMAQAEI